MVRPQLLARARAHAFQPLAVEQRRDHVGAAAHLDPLGGERREQRRGHLPRVDRRLVGRVDAAVEGRGQAGLQLAAAARRQPLGAEAERALQVVHAAQLGRLVAVEGDVEGTVADVAAAEPARRLQLGDEVRVDLGGGDRHPQQLGLAEGELADRRQHPGGDAGSAGRRLGAVEHDDFGAVLGKPPGAAEADHSAADNNYVIGASIAQALPPPALPGSGPDGRWPRCHPLSLLRLPYSTDATRLGNCSVAEQILT